MFIATRAAGSAKLRRSGMTLRSHGHRAMRTKNLAYAAPTELDRASGAVVAINMALLAELAGLPKAASHDSAKHDSVLR
jgi:hypothetical protein